MPDRKAFRKAIKEEVRLEEVLDVRREAAVIEKGRKQAVEATYERLATLTRRHDATRNEFHAVFSALDEARRAARAGLLDARFELKEKMTRKEWKKVYGKP